MHLMPISEVETLMKKLPHNPDGFSSEYYQIYNSILIPYLIMVFSASATDASFRSEV